MGKNKFIVGSGHLKKARYLIKRKCKKSRLWIIELVFYKR